MMAAPDAWDGGDDGRTKAGTALILIMGALACCTIAGYRTVVLQTREDAEPILMNEDRFTALRTLLPSRGVVGYLSDTGGLKPYYLTEYFLAPVVVAHDAARELVIGNFASPSAARRLASANGLRVERDFANGVALLRRLPK